MIDRKDFLKLCQQNSVHPKSVFVLVDGIKYHPKSLEISFDKNGKTLNRAILLDDNQNSLLNCPIEDVCYIDKIN
jgi:hypothetical protein